MELFGYPVSCIAPSIAVNYPGSKMIPSLPRLVGVSLTSFPGDMVGKNAAVASQPFCEINDKNNHKNNSSEWLLSLTTIEIELNTHAHTLSQRISMVSTLSVECWSGIMEKGAKYESIFLHFGPENESLARAFKNSTNRKNSARCHFENEDVLRHGMFSNPIHRSRVDQISSETITEGFKSDTLVKQDHRKILRYLHKSDKSESISRVAEDQGGQSNRKRFQKLMGPVTVL